MCVAAGGRRQVPGAREAFGLAIGAAGEQPGIIDLDRVGAREGTPGDVGRNAVSGALEGVGNDRDSSLLADALEGLREGQAGRNAFADTDGKDMARGGSDLHAGDADETIGGGQLGGFDARVQHVVVGDRKRVEADTRGLLE